MVGNESSSVSPSVSKVRGNEFRHPVDVDKMSHHRAGNFFDHYWRKESLATIRYAVPYSIDLPPHFGGWNVGSFGTRPTRAL